MQQMLSSDENRENQAILHNLLATRGHPLISSRYLFYTPFNGAYQ
jgi:hypothetical protein